MFRLRQLENRLHIVYVDGFKRFLVLNVVKTKQSYYKKFSSLPV